MRKRTLETNLSTPNQVVVECIEHANRNSKTLSSFGALESRINIAATKDVYENTKKRMAQVDPEKKDLR